MQPELLYAHLSNHFPDLRPAFPSGQRGVTIDIAHLNPAEGTQALAWVLGSVERVIATTGGGDTLVAAIRIDTPNATTATVSVAPRPPALPTTRSIHAITRRLRGTEE